MKISQPDRQKIRHLAELEGKPASHVIMELVDSELKRKVRPVPMTAKELRKLPAKERAKILKSAARRAVKDYEVGGELFIPDNGDILEG